MRFLATSILGIALSDRGIACAEVTVGSGSRTVRHVASMAWMPDAPLDNPQAAGKALAAFLRREKFTSHRAVVGVPAKWMIAAEKELPPSDAAQARAILALQSERMSLANRSELVFDYIGEPDRQSPSRALLVAMPRSRLTQTEQMMRAAGLTVLGMTSSALALAWAGGGEGHGSPMVLLADHGVEMVWEEHGRPRMLRHLSLPASNGDGPSMSSLGAELRRAVALGPATNGSGDVVLWDAMGLSDEQVADLARRAGVAVRTCRGAGMLRVASSSQSPGDVDRHAAAVALALAGGEPRLPLDFTRSRLAPAAKHRLSRRTVLLAALALAVIGSLVSLYADVRGRRTLLADLQRQLKDLEPDLKQAQQNLERINYGRGFFETRPQMLECLREITLTFRADERIWATSFTMRENGKGQLIGKASDQRTVLALLDRLKKNPRFAAATLLDMRDASDRSREVAFSIGMEFRSTE